MVVPADYSSKYVLQKSSLEKKRIGSFASHRGILDGEFEELLATGKLIKVHYWYKKMGIHVHINRDHSITWISFDEEFSPLQ